MKACLRHIVLALLCIVTLPCCDSLYPSAEKDRHMVLCYFSAHDNSLSQASRSVMDDLKNCALPPTEDDSNVLLVYYHLADTVPILSRFSRNEKGEFVEDRLMTYPGNSVISVKSLSKEQIHQVLVDARTLYPSTRQSFFISTHGSGYLPSGYLSDPEDHRGPLPEDPFRLLVKSGEDTRSIGPDDDIEINVPEFVSALSECHFDVILFDCCYMGGVEVAYEMKDICDYVVAAPTEVMSRGIICGDLILPSFAEDAGAAALSICNVYMNKVRTIQDFRSSGTIAAVKCSELPALAEACSKVFSSRRYLIDEINPSGVQPYFRNRQHWFYDLDDFVRQLCTNEDGSEDEAYAPFRTALDKAVLFKDTTPSFLEITIDKYSGLSTYIRNAECPNLNTYYKSLSWNRDTGFIR